MNLEAYQIFLENISSQSLLQLIIGTVIFAVGMYFYSFKKIAIWYYSCFFIGTVMIGIGLSTIADYLFAWDEQFHAVVAKSMLNNPFKPILFDEKYHLGYQYWSANHIWLHKQPLFLWQIAASYKIFGVNLLAVRIPSIVLHAATTVLVLSIAKRYLKPYLALLAATLFAFSDFRLGMVCGSIGMDHNDISFGFYITASFWAWIKYQESKKFKWVVWIGVCCGAAILCKWLVGLVVFSGWGIVLLSTELKSKTAWRHIFISLLIAFIVAIPWQVFCYINYKREFLYEMNYNSLHFFEGLESHTGDGFFYFKGMFDLYGQGFLVPAIIFFGLLLMLSIGIIKRNYYFIFGASVFIIVFVFFTIAATKMVAYMSITMVFGYISLLLPFNYINWKVRRNLKVFNPKILKFVLPVILLFVSFLFVRVKKMNHRFAFDDSKYVSRVKEKTNFAINEMRNDNNPSEVYFIKDSAAMNIAVQLRFFSDYSVFPYSADQHFENIGKIINVDGAGENTSVQR